MIYLETDARVTETVKARVLDRVSILPTFATDSDSNLIDSAWNGFARGRTKNVHAILH